MKNSVTFELQGSIHVGGFRPFFWKIVAEANLTGWIANSVDGVFLCLQGEDEQISSFIRGLPAKVPGAFRLHSVGMIKREVGIPDRQGSTAFRVIGDENEIPLINPDRAPCAACIEETMDPASRRFSYAFSSCYASGPSYSYALRSPFVRKNTSFTAFPMCADCRFDKENKEDHHHCGSEILACPRCGPQFFLLDTYGDLVTDANPLCESRKAIRNGEILALQSLYGGFQLFADAFNEETILRLRRKRKLPDRPLCLMARDLEAIRKYCESSPEEEALLLSPVAPVLILARKKDVEAPPLPSVISPDTDTLAVGLPPSLPEKLVFEHRGGGESVEPFELLVTCGDNRPGKAECLDIDEIFNRLMAYTDKFLCHDLKTSHPCPPSICLVKDGRPIHIRRSRGYIPRGIEFGDSFSKNVGAFGCDSQAAVAIGVGKEIIPSQALGAIENEGGTEILLDMFERFTYLVDKVPDIMACDMDRESFSARTCAAFAELHSLPLVTIQNHHAHALACMAEHGLRRSLAIVFNNGSGGPDGSEWGSECLDARLDGFSRLAAFQPVNADNTRPARLFLERLTDAGIEPSGALLNRLRVDPSEYQLWKKQDSVHGVQLSHSAMRLINTVCAGIGIAPDFCTYPERCLLILRKYASRRDPSVPVPDEIAARFSFSYSDENRFRLIDWSRTFQKLGEVVTFTEEEKSLYAEAFYSALGESTLAMALYAESLTGIRDIVLSGSIFQDPILLEKVREKLSAKDFTVYVHEKTSCDESCVPVGQTYAAGLT
ncbi:MAG: Carbamoyltransferase HypF [Lentisphaerae bacterium ADurb.Bin242]|nr:MAG: Carbamoyltransferase HypF [Lentisphaerae bacterium ADurb.Bin242]